MKEKILIVDDEEANLKLLAQWLIPLGYEIEFASNGEEAVKKAGTCSPDLIILDIIMPVMDGYEACRLIKAVPATQNIPVIMVTALSDMESRLQGLSLNANDFLSKPIDKSELTLRIKNLLKIKAFECFMLRHQQILEEEVEKRTAELEMRNEELRRTLGELEASRLQLEEKNAAIREVLIQLEVEKNNLQKNILANVDELILPLLNKFKPGEVSAKQISMLEKNFENLTSSFGRKISDKILKLTPKEIEICNMIRSDFSNKDIADHLNLSVQTVEKHRKNIRKKLGIINKKRNLRTYLQLYLR